MYQTVSATGPADLVDKIAIAAVAAGWTLDRNVLASGLRTVTVHKGGDYVHIYNLTTTDGFYVRGSVGYGAGLTPDTETNKSITRAFCNCGPGPFGNVYIFSENTPAEHLHGVIEMPGAIYRHFSFGSLVKAGAYTGGTYFTALFWWDNFNNNSNTPFVNYHHPMFPASSYYTPNRGGVRADADGNTNFFAPFAESGNPVYVAVALGGLGANAVGGSSANTGEEQYSGFYQRSINAWSAQTPITPIEIKLSRPSGFYSIIGEVPNIFFLNMSRYAAGDEFSIGSDVYKVFPWTRQGTGTGLQTYSHQAAFAYRKVV